MRVFKCQRLTSARLSTQPATGGARSRSWSDGQLEADQLIKLVAVLDVPAAHIEDLISETLYLRPVRAVGR